MTLAGISLIVIQSSFFAPQSVNEEEYQTEVPIQNESAPTTITSSRVTQDCQVTLTIGILETSLPTSFDPEVAKCDQYVVSRVSPLGGLAVFEDLSSSGVDSIVSLYQLESNRVFTLDDFGNQSVLDLAFLPNGKLLVLYSQGLSGTQTLRLYDIPNLEPLLADVPLEDDLSSETLNPFVFERVVEKTETQAKIIRVLGESVVLVDEADDVTNPILEISLSEL